MTREWCACPDPAGHIPFSPFTDRVQRRMASDPDYRAGFEEGTAVARSVCRRDAESGYCFTHRLDPVCPGALEVERGGWWHPQECSNAHNESGNCLDEDGSVVGWRDPISYRCHPSARGGTMTLPDARTEWNLKAQEALRNYLRQNGMSEGSEAFRLLAATLDEAHDNATRRVERASASPRG